MKLASSFGSNPGVLAALAMALAAPPASAADASADRRREEGGHVTWYTTQIVDQFVLPAAQAFQKKYGIKVNYVRADASEIALRMSNEAKAGKVQADVVDGTLTTPALEKQGFIMK